MTWLKSYLSDRSQTVVMAPFSSREWPVQHGVPQGSAISPLLFNIYLRPLMTIIKSFGIEVVNYADDVQLVFSLRGNRSIPMDTFQDCMDQTMRWLNSNSLQLNGEKTEVMYCPPSHSPSGSPQIFSLTSAGAPLVPVKTVRNLGVFIDDDLQLTTQATTTAKTCTLLLRMLWRILPLVPFETRSQIMRSTILSRLDYCNSLFLGAPQYLIQILSRIQAMAAKMALNRKRGSSTTLALRELHWLPVGERIQFKALCIAHRSRYGRCPLPLQERIRWYKPLRELRSAGACLMTTPRFKRTRFGERAFRVVVAQLWNSLPLDIRRMESLLLFRKALKTWLFPK